MVRMENQILAQVEQLMPTNYQVKNLLVLAVHQDGMSEVTFKAYFNSSTATNEAILNLMRSIMN